MAQTPSPSPSARHNGNRKSNYTFYDEDYKPMWKRGISRKIGESAFVQQKLPTHRLSWSPYRICPLFLLMGALFIGIGIGIKRFSDNIQEVIIPYTNCVSIDKPGRGEVTCADVINPEKYRNSTGQSMFHQDAIDIENCTCSVNFELKEPLNGTVYMYYTLTNFYQNHKDCYLSRDENQLKGNLFNDNDKDEKPKSPSSACEPFHRVPPNDTNGKIIYPCGLMANGMFTDVIEMFYHPTDDMLVSERYSIKDASQREKTDNENTIFLPKALVTVPLRNTGIAWQSDRWDKYENPPEFRNSKNPVWRHYTKPWGWKKTIWELDSANFSNNGVQNEDFIVWMRAAAFPWFRKLYRIVDSKNPFFSKGLPKGNYSLKIDYNYDVSTFEGEKQIVLITSNVVAGKNMFLAIAYMATGSLCIFLAIVLFMVQKFFAPSLDSIEESFKVK